MNKLRVCVAGLSVIALTAAATAAEHPAPRRAIGAAWATGVPGLEVRPLPNYSFDWQRPVEGGDGGAIPVMYCFDPSQPPSQEVMQMVEAAIRGYAGRYNANASWSSNPGTPITLTWSFVPDGVQINDNFSNSQSNLFSRMDQLFGAANRAVWIAQFEASFNRYSEISGVRYVRVQSGANPWDDGASWGAGRSSVRGDIRIAMKPLDGGSGVLAYNSFPTNGDMVLDSSENWASSANSYRFLRNIIMHEHGHGLGFSHVCPIQQTKLMEPFYTSSFDGLQQDDIRGVHENYGDVNEPNNSSGVATALGSVTTSQVFGNVPSPTPAAAATFSLDRPQDQDWFVFSSPTPRLFTITAAPVGTTYTDVDQNANGSCQNSGNVTQALSIANLRLTVYAANGSNILRTAASTGAGEAETVTSLLIAAGDAYIRVDSNQNFNETQLYKLTVTPQLAPLFAFASDGVFTDKVRIDWSAVPDAAIYRVNRGVLPDGSDASPIANVTTTFYEDTDVIPGQTYYYTLEAHQGDFQLRQFAGPESGFAAVPANEPPVANAGLDFSVTDNDGNGSELVTLDGSGSSDPDGTIVNYRWMEGPTVLANGASPTAQVTLSVGVHNIILTVTDNDGDTDDDTLVVTVEAGSCPADWDGSGGVDGDDIAAFFADWQVGNADIDNSGGTDGDDITFFFARWQAGC